jgi:hypothetical protein
MHPSLHSLANRAAALWVKALLGFPMALHFGGFLLSLIYSGSKKQRFHCRECAEPFYSHKAISRGYRLLFILFVALFAVWIVGESLEIMRGS